jgi:hypothetical protein
VRALSLLQGEQRQMFSTGHDAVQLGGQVKGSSLTLIRTVWGSAFRKKKQN